MIMIYLLLRIILSIQIIHHHVYAEIIITLRVFFKANKNVLKKANILSFGFNRLGNINKNDPGIHAEHDAINKLKPLQRKNRLETVNILVVRFSKNNKLQNSKPCANCIQTMKNLPQKKGYRIRNIYYSNDNGDIEKTNLNNLENDDQHYSRFYKHQIMKT